MSGCENVGVCRFCRAEVGDGHVCENMAVMLGGINVPFGSAIWVPGGRCDVMPFPNEDDVCGWCGMDDPGFTDSHACVAPPA